MGPSEASYLGVWGANGREGIAARIARFLGAPLAVRWAVAAPLCEFHLHKSGLDRKTGLPSRSYHHHPSYRHRGDLCQQGQQRMAQLRRAGTALTGVVPGPAETARQFRCKSPLS